MTARQCGWLLVLVALCTTGVACKDSMPSENPLTEALQLRGAGATFPAPLYKKWLEEYTTRHPEVLLSYDSIGSGEGAKQFLANAVDFGASDAALSDEEMTQVARGVQLLPVVAGSIVLAYHLDGLGGELKLTRDVYADISLGK